MDRSLFTDENLKNIKDRIRELYDTADDVTQLAGATWYAKAYSKGCIMAQQHHLTTWQVFRMIARLSPQCEWERNLRDTEAVIVHGMDTNVTTFRSHQRKAVAMRDDPTLHDFNEKTGPKITAFYDNMSHPWDSQKVTIDRHICVALFGAQWRKNTSILGRASHLSPRQYRLLANGFRKVAAELGILPHQLQATIWLRQKGFLKT